jgi:alginate O-acetyltransferase complex protein AlgI
MRDYLYVPLGGNRRGDVRTAVNLMATMLLAGLWHGASFSFVVWGALHGAALVVHRFGWATRRRRTALPGGAAFAWAATLLFTVVAFVVFRADSIAVATTMLERMVSAGGGGIHWFHAESVVVLGLAVVLHVATALRRERPWSFDLRRPRHAAAAVVLLLLVLLFAPVGSGPFLYFQF